MKPFVVLLAACVTGLISSGDSRAAATDMAAGCYVPLDGGVALTINRLTRTVQLPIGSVEVGESMQQAAARETREEIGIDVDVGNRLLTLRDGRVAIFVCSPREPVVDYTALRAGDTNEVGEILVLNPHTLKNFDGRKITNRWRHPPLRFLLRALYSPARSKTDPQPNAQ